ncbi:uncharacterized protein PHACADRAFT_33847 [Phanerochaete carnosa HHB-10118-sp]|uniref:Uncharacterized protein n=1 Tax=Phanerochaete carnosa (strain HHB-10118-sp) TaxID=650164 RepID=K5UGA8_PHACS|nr:uncharacterized protein PHACADRAFT_33847 [Phanerochaete carnosa HHB-10118-sp]EKM48511.1 hypothetical protein PHACADRAFT_33847 [Phanerochaete carnosa HHB-10118-sp]
MTSVLPKSWLAPRTNEATRPPESSKPATLPVPSYDDPAKVSPNSAWLGAERAVTAALSTPHDAVLAELQGRTPKVGSSQLSGPAVMSSASPERAQDAGASPTQTSPLTEASPEPVYDPFSGGLAYVLPPRTPPDGDAGEFGQSTDELWAQLSRIRELQSEIAGMHVQMEGMGAADGRVLRKAHARTPTDNVHSGEWPDPAEEEEDRKRERDTQFANLTQAFEGRHASIDNIMNKVGALIVDADFRLNHPYFSWTTYRRP